MPDELKVTKMSEQAAFDQGGKMSLVVSVTFYDGEHGPFTLQFPKEGFSPTSARAAIEAYVRDLRSVRGV